MAPLVIWTPAHKNSPARSRLASASKQRKNRCNAPPHDIAVWQMKSNDSTNTFWIACDSALYRLALDTQQWSLQLPSPDLPDHPLVGGPKTLTACSNCVAAAMSSGGFAICNVADDRWTHLNLSTNRSDNEVTTLSIDVARPNYLWLGGRGKVNHPLGHGHPKNYLPLPPGLS